MVSLIILPVDKLREKARGLLWDYRINQKNMISAHKLLCDLIGG
jgi:hypothetical protein